MAEVFDVVESGDVNIACDTFTQTTSKSVMATYLVYGAAGGPYERVDSATPLPVTIISGTPSLNCEYADGATWVDGSSKGILNSGVYQATPQTIADGKIGPVQLTANGYQIVSVNGTVTVGSHAVTNAGTFAVQAAQSGTWTVDLGATDNAVLDAIAASVAGTLTVGTHAVTQSGTWNIGTVTTVTAVTSITNAVTVSQGTAANLNCTEASAAAIKTAVQLIDNTVYVDDADFTDGVSSGNLMFGLYQSSPQSITDGDVGPIQVTQNGYPIVSVNGTLTVGSHAVTNAGTFAVQAAQSGTWNITNVSGTVSLPTGASTAAKQPALGTAGTASTDVITVQGITSMTPLLVTLSGTNNIATVTTVTTVSTVTAVSDAQVQGKAAHDAAASGNPVLLGAYASAAAPSDVSGDADAVRLWALRNGSQVCNLAVGGTLVTSSAGLPTAAAGDVAHDGVDSGNPIKVGFKAVAHGATPTEVAASDRVQWHANRAGVPFVIGGHPNVKCHAVLIPAGGAQTNVAMFTVASGTKIVVTRVTVVLDGATAAETNVRIGFGTATLTSPNTTTAGTGLLLEASGFGSAAGVGSNVINIGDGSGILGVGADGEEIRYTCEDPGSGNLSISVSYYEVSS